MGDEELDQAEDWERSSSEGRDRDLILLYLTAVRIFWKYLSLDRHLPGWAIVDLPKMLPGGEEEAASIAEAEEEGEVPGFSMLGAGARSRKTSTTTVAATRRRMSRKSAVLSSNPNRPPALGSKNGTRKSVV